MNQQKLLCSLKELEKNNHLSITKIEQSAKILADNQEFSKRSWKVISQNNGLEYIYLNGQLLPKMHDKCFIVNKNWSNNSGTV